MHIDMTERGNNAFHNDDGAIVFFGELEENFWLQSSYTPGNYPAYNISTLTMTKGELINHISEHLGGWTVDKCQLNVNIHPLDGTVLGTDDVVNDIVDDVLRRAYQYEFNPTASVTAMNVSVLESANLLEYYLTEKMRDMCFDKINEEYEAE